MYECRVPAAAASHATSGEREVANTRLGECHAVRFGAAAPCRARWYHVTRVCVCCRRGDAVLDTGARARAHAAPAETAPRRSRHHLLLPPGPFPPILYYLPNVHPPLHR